MSPRRRRTDPYISWSCHVLVSGERVEPWRPHPRATAGKTAFSSSNPRLITWQIRVYARLLPALNGSRGAPHRSAGSRKRETGRGIRAIRPWLRASSGVCPMNDHSDIAGLVRAVRARVPMDAAQLLVKETPERIGAVLAELPQMLVDRIKAYLPTELQLQASESLAEVIEDTVGEMMEPALAVLPQTTTVQRAIAFLRNHETPQQITYLYVTDAEDKLVGLIVIRDLLLAKRNQTLADVMLPEPFAL